MEMVQTTCCLVTANLVLSVVFMYKNIINLYRISLHTIVVETGITKDDIKRQFQEHRD